MEEILLEEDLEEELEDEELNGADDENDGISGLETAIQPAEGTGQADNSIPFAHLHLHSHYSLLDGAGKIDALIARARELGMTAMALTDHGNLYGSLEFYQKCLAANIKPILGYEAYMASGSRFEHGSQRSPRYHLTLLAMNKKGYDNLLVLGTKAYTEGYYYKPRIDKELLREYSEGLICLSGCMSSELSRTLLNGNGSREAIEQGKEIAGWYRDLFGDRYYIEIQNHGIPQQQMILEASVQLAREMGIPTVATNDVHYVLQEDADAQDLLLCINTGKYRTDTNRMRMDSDQFYIRTGREMLDALPGHEDAIRRTMEIADRCHLDLELGKRFFPNFIPPDGKTSDEYLRELCIAGLKRRFADDPKRLVDGKLSEEVMTRLNRELDVISKLGFPNYFLIVWDFVRVAEERGIHRTARGSGVGALVCYALNLSHVCPLDFDLLFERFLDENRLEAPDIDIDFEKERRGEILDYVKEKYGENNVAQIGTFGTMAAKMAIRDVGRALGMQLPNVNEITKMIPEAPKMTLSKAYQDNPELVRLKETNEDIRELLTYAEKVEGLARSAGTHACAVVISERPLTDFVPIQRVQGKKEFVTQWAAADVEKAGLLKMDFLGLKNLSILANVVNMIEKTTGKRIDPYKVPLDDKKTYRLLCRGETKGIFQLEGGGIRELLTRMKPDSFKDIIATLALYRPGPLEGGMVDDYVDVKHNRKKPVYAHSVMKEVLEETHGVMVYQEQVMRILNRLGKIPLANSYTCIKAISKKKYEKIEKFRGDFIQGAQENGLTKEKAAELFGLIEKFAGYGFNKSHSTAYALVAYMTAYLKSHYPVEFMAALLCGDIYSRNFTQKDDTVEHLEDCQRMNIEVLPPHVNNSFESYQIKDGKITFGLTAIKGCGEDHAREIVRARTNDGPFKNIFDFYERVNPRIVSRGTVESLIKAGAFDGLGARRSQMMSVLDKAIKRGQTIASDRIRGQKSLFELLDGPENNTPQEETKIVLPDVKEWGTREKAAYEKEVLGFYLTTHPLLEYRDKFQTYTTHTIEAALSLPAKTEVVLGGSISAIKIGTGKNQKKNQPNQYAMFDFEDVSGMIRTIAWSNVYSVCSKKITADSIVFIKGKIDRSRDTPNLIADEIIGYEEADKKLASGLRITIQEQLAEVSDIKILYDILKTYRSNASNGMTLELGLRFHDGLYARMKCPDFYVTLTDELRTRVTERFGESAISLIPVKRNFQKR